MSSPTVLKHEVRQNFAQWFFHRRKKELGLSQEMVAEISGLTRQQIIRIEKGESGTTRKSLPGLASLTPAKPQTQKEIVSNPRSAKQEDSRRFNVRRLR